MLERRDRVDIPGVPSPEGPEAGPGESPGDRRWLGILFNCCHVYGRIYRNRAGTEYVGRCPSCGHPVRAAIGPGGSRRRMFGTS
ncbi:MAG: hypothetical protein KDA21_02415 [Phycisphaerales bacterium]|nr:hypothetical protein [Phycisphaerales bacterium]